MIFSSQLDIPSVDVLISETEELKKHLKRVESPTVLCHNDLLTKNIIYNSDEGEMASSCVVKYRHVHDTNKRVKAEERWK